MLSGDNGILQKATTAKENTDSSQIQERINLAYHSSLVDGQGEVTEPSLESELKKEFNKTTLDDDWIDKTSVEGKWKITIDGISLAVPAGVVNETSSIINYGNKTAETVDVGDDITIDTEKFKVIKKSTDGKKITAMPYYNLVLNQTPIKQATLENAGTEVGNAGTTAFSSEKFWTGKGIDIDAMSSSNIQTYIEEYQMTLQNLGASNVTTRVVKYSDVQNLTAEQCNPSGVGTFWLGTTDLDGVSDAYIWCVNFIAPRVTGHLYSADFHNAGYMGVRPAIIITN